MSAIAQSDLEPDLEAVADRLVSTLQCGDVDGWMATYADDGVIWHSYDGVVMTAAENTELLRGLWAQVLRELRYDDVRRYQIAGGYVQQHTLRMTALAGTSYEIGVCVVVKVKDGRVQRMDEYLDSSVFQFAGANG